MMRAFIVAFVLSLIVSFVILKKMPTPDSEGVSLKTWWAVQSVDTMKYSRDLTSEKLHDSSFDAVIDIQVKNIAATGATHVAIATPYDEEFVPMLKRWILAARKYKLGVWFRGNFAGWEQWFNHALITRDEHMQKSVAFIRAHPDLFVDGDIFTACPECENGGPGDPRTTGDINGFRLFMIKEHKAVSEAFGRIGKRVTVNYNSMNYDVASLVMDKDTTRSVGGVVAIDHYVTNPKKIAEDVRKLAQASGGKIFLGEFGAPIPDIHGNMNDEGQSAWIEEALSELASEPSLIGLNYWVNVGGSTELWNEENSPKSGVTALTKYFKPKLIYGNVYNTSDRPIANVEVTTSHKSTKTDKSGQFSLPVLPSDTKIFIHSDNYTDMEAKIDESSEKINIIIRKIDKSLITRVLDYLNSLFK